MNEPTPHQRRRQSAAKGQRARPRLMCSRTGCGRIARYESINTGASYCPDHAADLCLHIVLRPVEGFQRTNHEGAA